MTQTIKKEKTHAKRRLANIAKNSYALDLEKNIFTSKDPRSIAISLKKSAEENVLRKTTTYATAMSMLNFYIDHAGKDLGSGQKIILKQTKDELHHIFHK